MLIPFLIFIASFFLGYWAHGSQDMLDDTQQSIEEGIKFTKKGIRKLTTKDLPTGQIKPKTAKQIQERSLPDKIREGRQAMKEELDSHPELATRRKLIEDMKKQGKL